MQIESKDHSTRVTKTLPTASQPLPAARLSSLLPGQKGRVVALECEGLHRRRLLDLGLTPGVQVEAVMRAALGDPMAFRVRDSLMALRREQAEQILIHRLDSSDPNLE